MASIGHVAVGLALGRARGSGRPLKRLLGGMTLFSALAMLPDADVVAFKLGIPYGAEWGHRGASHSLALAVGVALVVAGVTRALRGPAGRMGVLALLAVGSHGLLDALTDGGLGAALLWPFSQARLFAPVRPLPVAPIGRAWCRPGAVRGDGGVHLLPAVLGLRAVAPAGAGGLSDAPLRGGGAGRRRRATRPGGH